MSNQLHPKTVWSVRYLDIGGGILAEYHITARNKPTRWARTHKPEETDRYEINRVNKVRGDKIERYPYYPIFANHP